MKRGLGWDTPLAASMYGFRHSPMFPLSVRDIEQWDALNKVTAVNHTTYFIHSWFDGSATAPEAFAPGAPQSRQADST